MTLRRIFATMLSALQSEQRILERQLEQVKKAVAALRGLGRSEQERAASGNVSQGPGQYRRSSTGKMGEMEGGQEEMR